MMVSVLLVACGSGSSNGGAPANDINKQPDYTTGAGAVIHQVSSEKGKITGNISYSKNFAKTGETFVIADDAESIILGGEKIILRNSKDDKKRVIKDIISDNVFFAGVIYPNNELLFFIGGKPTQEMPKQGKAEYKLLEGNGHLEVTFAGQDKGVVGEMYAYKKENGKVNQLTYKVKADIVGNTFQGTHKYNSKRHSNRQYETHLRGGFYGKAASEAAGIWYGKTLEDSKIVHHEGDFFYGVKK